MSRVETPQALADRWWDEANRLQERADECEFDERARLQIRADTLRAASMALRRALEADASPSASEPLPDGEILRRCGLPIHYAAIGKWTQAKAIAELRSILGRSEPTRTEVEREIADWLEQDSDCENEEEAAAQIRAGEYRLKGTP